jgi:hypothetical protein
MIYDKSILSKLEDRSMLKDLLKRLRTNWAVLFVSELEDTKFVTIEINKQMVMIYAKYDSSGHYNTSNPIYFDDIASALDDMIQYGGFYREEILNIFNSETIEGIRKEYLSRILSDNYQGSE